MPKLFGRSHSSAQTPYEAFFAENKCQHHQFLHTFSLFLLFSVSYLPSWGFYQILTLPRLPLAITLQVQINPLCPYFQNSNIHILQKQIYNATAQNYSYLLVTFLQVLISSNAKSHVTFRKDWPCVIDLDTYEH